MHASSRGCTAPQASQSGVHWMLLLLLLKGAPHFQHDAAEEEEKKDNKVEGLVDQEAAAAVKGVVQGIRCCARRQPRWQRLLLLPPRAMIMRRIFSFIAS